MTIDTITYERLSTWERDQATRDFDRALNDLRMEVNDLKDVAMTAVNDLIAATDHLLLCEEPDGVDGNACWECREHRQKMGATEKDQWLLGVDVDRHLKMVEDAASRVMPG